VAYRKKGRHTVAYRIFVRNFWRKEKHRSGFGNELIPNPSARKTIKVATEDEARRTAQEYNTSHKPGALSRKAEYEEIW